MIHKAILIGCRPTGFLYFTVPSAAALSSDSIFLSLTISIYLFLFNITLILRRIPLSNDENGIESGARKTGLDTDDKLMAVSLLEVAGYTKIHVKFKILIPGQYPENICCRIPKRLQ
jgi:hypothetical protein